MKIYLLCASRELNNLIYKIYDESKESNVELCFKHNLSLLKDDYDYIIIDNSPFKSYLTTCAMCASNKIITPICVDNFSYDGLMSLFDTIEDLNAKYALSIEFAGMFMTRVAGRTTLYKQMFESYENMFGDKFLPVSIRNCIAVNESNTLFEPLLTYDKRTTAPWNFSEEPRLLRNWKYCTELAPWATACMEEAMCIPGFFSLETGVQLVLLGVCSASWCSENRDRKRTGSG